MPSRIASIRERLVRARVALVKPGADLAELLRELALTMEEARGLGPDTPVRELAALQTELAALGKLARNGEKFWRGWGRLLGLEPSYSASGARPEASPTSRIAVQG